MGKDWCPDCQAIRPVRWEWVGKVKRKICNWCGYIF